MVNANDIRTSDELQVEIDRGERVKALIALPGWEDVVGAVKDERDGKLFSLINTMKPSESGVKYADRVAEIRGLEAFTEIAHQIVEGGESAAEQLEYLEAQA